MEKYENSQHKKNLVHSGGKIIKNMLWKTGEGRKPEPANANIKLNESKQFKCLS